MLDEARKALANYRLENAYALLDTADLLVREEKYKDAVNRSYYSIFSSMRAMLALDGVDFKKHSGVIAYFRKEYIKTEKLEKDYSKIIDQAFRVRNQSDYDDFFIVSKEEAVLQLENAERFYHVVKTHIQNIN